MDHFHVEKHIAILLEIPTAAAFEAAERDGNHLLTQYGYLGCR